MRSPHAWIPEVVSQWHHRFFKERLAGLQESARPGRPRAFPPPGLTVEIKALADEFVISTDEKTSIQARLRTHPSLPTEPGKSMRVEHEYARSLGRQSAFSRYSSPTGC